MPTRAERIAALEEKARVLRDRAAKLAAIDTKAERKKFERKKYVAGAALMAALQAGKVEEAWVRDLVAAFNNRATDRALFGLDPLPGQESTEG